MMGQVKDFCRRVFLIAPLVLLASCATKFTEPIVRTSLYDPRPVRVETGIASWYRDHRTASGERFSNHAMTAAHRKLPFGTMVRVVDLKTGKSIIVKINDRGPFIRGRIIDLTVGAANELGTYKRGIAKVRVEVLKEIPVMTKPNLRDRPERKPSSPSEKPKPRTGR